MVQSCRTETHIQIYLSKQSLLNIFFNWSRFVSVVQQSDSVVHICVCVCVCAHIYSFPDSFFIIGYYKILKRFFECFTNTHCEVSEEAKLRNCIIGGLCNKWEIFFFNPFFPQNPVKTLACITDFSLAEPLLKLLISSGIHHLQC